MIIGGQPRRETEGEKESERGHEGGNRGREEGKLSAGPLVCECSTEEHVMTPMTQL